MPLPAENPKEAKQELDKLIDEKEETNNFGLLLAPFAFSAFKRGIRLIRDTISPTVGFDDVANATAQKNVQRLAIQQSAQALRTTKGLLSRVIQEAIDEGEGNEELARRIERDFGAKTRLQSRRIARTETTHFMNNGQLDTLKAEGFEKKQWVTNIDGRERQSHARASGQKVFIDAEFTVGSGKGKHPGDPNLPVSELVNCRCSMIGVGRIELSDSYIKALDRRFKTFHGTVERDMGIALRKEFQRLTDDIIQKIGV